MKRRSRIGGLGLVHSPLFPHSHPSILPSQNHFLPFNLPFFYPSFTLLSWVGLDFVLVWARLNV